MGPDLFQKMSKMIGGYTISHEQNDPQDLLLVNRKKKQSKKKRRYAAEAKRVS